MWIFPLAMLVVMLVVVFLIFGRGGAGPGCFPPGSHRRDAPRQEQPLEILKKRYARGEISKEEFDQIRKDLSS